MFSSRPSKAFPVVLRGSADGPTPAGSRLRVGPIRGSASLRRQWFLHLYNQCNNLCNNQDYSESDTVSPQESGASRLDRWKIDNTIPAVPGLEKTTSTLSRKLVRERQRPDPTRTSPPAPGQMEEFSPEDDPPPSSGDDGGDREGSRPGPRSRRSVVPFGEAKTPAQARIPSTTLPPTFVKRASMPWNLTVRRRWLMPSRWSMVAWRSLTLTGFSTAA